MVIVPSSFTEVVIFTLKLFEIFTKKKESVKTTMTKNSANLKLQTNLCCESYDGLIGNLYDYPTEQNNTSLDGSADNRELL